MQRVIGFINIYRSGLYHTEKDGAYNRHGGDIYPTREMAEGAIHPKTHFIDTIPVVWIEDTPQMNDLVVVGASSPIVREKLPDRVVKQLQMK